MDIRELETLAYFVTVIVSVSLILIILNRDLRAKPSPYDEPTLKNKNSSYSNRLSLTRSTSINGQALARPNRAK